MQALRLEPDEALGGDNPVNKVRDKVDCSSKL
jgi:hypothetical protein